MKKKSEGKENVLPVCQRDAGISRDKETAQEQAPRTNYIKHHIEKSNQIHQFIGCGKVKLYITLPVSARWHRKNKKKT